MSKKALVMNQDHPQHGSKGDIKFLDESSAVDAWTNFLKSNSLVDEVIVPEELEDIGMGFLEATLNPEFWSKYEEDDVFVDPEDETWTYNAPAWELSEKAKTDTQLIGEAYNDMNTDVYAEMAVVFGTNNAESATAYKETWELMVATPSDWSDKGLTARFAVGDFEIGDDLDTNQKITDYATAKVAEVNAYGIYRMQRIQQFRDEKDAILA